MTAPPAPSAPAHRTPHRTDHRPARVALAALLGLGLLAGASGCAAPEAASTGDRPGAAGTGLALEDAWVKAVDDGMSAAFGILVNPDDADITVLSATCDASPIMELHETVENADGQMVMREKAGGFVIPARTEYLLEPGANHLMLMDVVTPIRAGEQIDCALELADGGTLAFSAPVKDYSGANETYVSE